jgi:hypothetical protein
MNRVTLGTCKCVYDAGVIYSGRYWSTFGAHEINIILFHSAPFCFEIFTRFNIIFDRSYIKRSTHYNHTISSVFLYVLKNIVPMLNYGACDNLLQLGLGQRLRRNNFQQYCVNISAHFKKII